MILREGVSDICQDCKNANLQTWHVFLNYTVIHIKINRIKLKSDTEYYWLLNLGWGLTGSLQMISSGNLVLPPYNVPCFREVTVAFLDILEPE